MPIQSEKREKIFFLSAAAAEALASVFLSLPAAAAPPRRTCFSGIWTTAVLGSGPAAFLLAQGSAKAGRRAWWPAASRRKNLWNDLWQHRTVNMRVLHNQIFRQVYRNTRAAALRVK